MSARNRGTGTLGPVRRGHAIVPVPAAAVAAGGTTGGGGVSLPIVLTTDVSGRLPLANVAQGSALSVLGVTGNATADEASIVAGSDGQVLRRSGTAVAFGAVSLSTAAAVTGKLPLANVAAGTALSVLGVAGNAGADYADISAGSDGQVMRRSGTTLAFGAVSLSTAAAVTGQLPWANLANVSATARILGRTTAGAGVIEELTLTQALDLVGSAAQGDILFRGSAGWKRLATGTSGQLLTSQGAAADLQWASLTGGTVGVGAFFTGTGHPQGVLAAAIGAHYVDTNTGYVYRKFGGGSTSYGWYLIPMPGLGPMPIYATPSGVQAVNPTTARANGYGPFFGSAGDSADVWASPYTGATTGSEVYSQGRYMRIASTNVSATNTYMSTQTASNRLYLDDDIDLWVDMLTDATAVSSIRYWFAFSSAAITDTATLGSASNGAVGIRFSTAESDGGWVGFTQKNGGANQTVSSTIASIAAATKYRLRIRFVRQGTPTLFASVNDSAEQAIATNIPNTGNNYFMVFGLTTKAAAVRSFAWRQFGGVVYSA